MSKRPREVAQPQPSAKPVSTSVSSKRSLWFALAAALVTFAVFSFSIDHPFVVWDDDANFVNNPAYRGLGPSELRWMFTTFHEGPYQPLSWITLGLDYIVWGMNAWGYHLTNVLIHSAAAGILCLLAMRLHAARAVELSQRALFFGLAVSFLWSLHPLRVEAVSWVTERREVLCGALSFLALLVAARGGRFWIVGLLALGAMLAKGTAVTLAPLLILLDVALSKETELRALVLVTLRSARRHALVIALAFAFAAIAVLGQHETHAIVSYEAHGWGDRFRIFFNGIGFYVSKTIVPVGLAPMYDPPLDRSTLTLPAAISIAALVAFVALTWRSRRRIGHLWTLGVAYFVVLLPVGGLVQVGGQMAADRYCYQPGAVIVLAVVACVGLLFARNVADGTISRAHWFALIALSALLSWRCIKLQGIWSDSITLWRHELAEYPESPIAHLHLGILYRDGLVPGGTPADAEAHFKRAIQRLPNYADAWCALGELYAHTGRADAAFEAFDHALSAVRDHRATLVARADLLWTQRRIDESLATLRRLAESAPNDFQAHLLYGEALATAGDTRAALPEYELALRADSRVVHVWTEYAWILATHPDPSIRDGQRALELVQSAMQRFGADERLVVQARVAALAEVGRFDEAIAILRNVRRTLTAEEGGALIDGWIAQFERREPLRVEPAFR